MAAGKRGFTPMTAIIISAVLAVATTPSRATIGRPWFLAAVERVLGGVTFAGKAEAQGEQTAAAKSYVSRVTKDENAIVLKGAVPSENDLKVLQGVAAATSPGAAFLDKTHVDPQVPDRDSWLAGMTFALRQLAKLQSGSVVLKDNVLTVDGVTKADDNFSAVRQKLSEELPKGLILEEIGLRPPAARPFVWLAKSEPGSVSLSGHVPDGLEQTLYTYAKSVFQHATVSDAMSSAIGAPEDWISAAELSLDMLTLLQEGSVMLQDRAIKISGIFAAPHMGDLLKTYSLKLPKGFALETHILEPTSVAPTSGAREINLAGRSAARAVNP